MELKSFFIKTVSAQTQANSHPTIPYIPPGTTPSPIVTVSPTPQITGPIITLFTNKTQLTLGESSTIEVRINTKGIEIDEFTVIIEFDPNHIQISDNDISLPGVQLEYLDTHFLLTSDGNKVEQNITTNQSDNTGRITLKTIARDDVPITISDRAIAKINFNVISNKVSNVVINTNESSLLIDNVDQLDTQSIRPLELNSSTNVIPTVNPSGVVIPTPTPIGKLVDTALSPGIQSSIVLGTGILLIIAGVFIRSQITRKNV